MLETKIIAVGTSSGIILHKSILGFLDARRGDYVNITLDGDGRKIVLEKLGGKEDE